MIKEIIEKAKGANPFKLKLPSFPRFNFWGKRLKLYRVWKRFLRQIPPTYRHFIQSYPKHFIVLGDSSSGKSQLIQKFIDQERDLFSFETTYTTDTDVQFYVGQKYILQEISWTMVEDRTVRAKKELTHLWRHLYLHRDPTVVVTYNPLFWEKADSEKINHHARLLLNKISLLSHIIDKPIKIRIAFTHIDQVEGYSELLRNLRMYGHSLEIPLELYDNNTLKETFQSYEQYLPLILKNSSAEDYLKVLGFFKRLPDFTYTIDQFIRSLMQKDFEKKLVILESGHFISNHETDISSNIFNYVQSVTPSVFIKRHHFKHQVACGSLALLSCCYLGAIVFNKKQDLANIKNKISLLERYQSREYLEKLLPSLNPLVKVSSSKPLISSLHPFYVASHTQLSHNFIEYSRDYILPEIFQKILLKKESEIEMVYFFGLAKATQDNRLGELILENASEWGEVLHVPESFIKCYVTLSKEPQDIKKFLESFTTLYTSTPLTDYKPWLSLFSRVQMVCEKPSLLENSLGEIQQEAAKLGVVIEGLRKHSLTPFVCKILLEEQELKGQKNFLPKLQLLQSLRENREPLENLLTQIKETSLLTPSFKDLSLSAFLNSLKDYLSASDASAASYHFILANQSWKFESAEWNRAVTNLRAKKMIDDYMAENRDLGDFIFFKSAGELFDLDLAYLAENFPAFKKKKAIPAYYTQPAYEKNVYPVADKIAKLKEANVLDFDTLNTLNKFVMQEVESYARHYKNQYQEALDLFNTTPLSIEEALKTVGTMVEPLSNFTHFLYSMRNNLKLPLSDSRVLEPMQHFKEFQFFQLLLPDDVDKAGELLTYQKLIQKMIRELKAPAANSEENTIAKYLTPLAEQSLANLQKQSSSYLAQAEAWVQKTGVPSPFHRFFLNPVIWIHELGLKDLENSLQLAWAEECQPAINALSAKFPFNPSATEAITADDLKKSLHPSSPFWARLEQILAPVSLQRNGKWEPHLLKLKEEIYQIANGLTATKRALWDEEGNPKPLHFKVQTLPFRKHTSGNKMTVLSYLMTEKSQPIYNINQQPQWETFAIHWWEPEDISIGLEMMDSETKKRTYQNLKLEKKTWNFFQLLKQAKQKDDHIWEWHLSDNIDHEFALYFQDNPWKVINARS